MATASRLSTSPRRVVLRNVTILRGKTSVEVHIETSTPVRPVARVFSGPDRIVVDLAGVGYDRSRRFSVSSGDVQDVRVALFQTNPPVTRVVVDLAHPHEYRVLPAGSTVILAIDTSPKLALAKSVPANVAPAASSIASTSAGGTVALKIPPVAAPNLPAKPQPVELLATPATQSSEPQVSTALPEVSTIAVPTDSTQLSAAAQDETTPHQAAKGNRPAVVRSVTVSREKDSIQIHIEGSKPLRASASTLSNPERIIIELADARVSRPRRIPVNAGGVETVNVALFLVNPLVTRVTVDMARARPFHLQASGNSLTIRIDTDEIKTAGSQPER